MGVHRILYQGSNTVVLQLRNYLSVSCIPVSCRYIQQSARNNVQKPKRPMNIFFMYAASLKEDMLRENPTLNYPQILKSASAQWTTLDDAKKLEWKKIYDEKYRQYLIDLTAYNQYKFTHGIKDTKLSKKDFKNLGKPKKAPTPYLLYFTSQLRERKLSGSVGEKAKTLSKEWKEMSEADKEKYVIEAEQLKAKYGKSMEEWKQKMIELGYGDLIQSHDQKSTKDETLPQK